MDPTQALLDALRAGDEDAARALLATHPGVRNARAPGGLPLLQMALYARASRLVDTLLEMGVQPTVHEAAIMGDTARVRAIVSADPAERDARGADGMTPLHLAAHFGRTGTVIALLNLDADPGAVGSAPLANTPLHAALAGGQLETAKLLLAAGAPVDARDAGGNTPLHVAAANGLVEGARLLLAHGAQRDAANHAGRTPLALAREREMDEVMEVLGPPIAGD